MTSRRLLPAAFCSARAGGEGLKWRDAFRPDTSHTPWSGAEVKGEPEPRGAARRAASPEHGEHGEDRTLTAASTMAPRLWIPNPVRKV